jgi:VWFA-related protein
MRILWALGLLLVSASAQDRPDTVIRTTTRLVQIRVMAEDAHGNKVTDLGKDELRLLDNRKPQAIDSFVAEPIAPPASPDGELESTSTAPEEARDDYAMILMDWLNPRFDDRLAVREKVNRLLRDFKPRQMMALYLLGHDSGLLHDFTVAPAELLQSLANTPNEAEDPFDPAKPLEDDSRFKTWIALSPEDRTSSFNLKILDTVAILGKLADGLTRIPGRKSLIWVTNGFPIVLDSRAVPGMNRAEISYRNAVESLISKFARANVALYTLDARGLQATHPKATPSYGDVATLQELSARTGGTFFSGNDIDAGMRQALDDSKVSYTLVFVVPPGSAPGLHRIQLRTTRAGVTLRYRESYDAPAK